MITGRFLRHMFIVSTDAFEDVTLSKIFNTIMEWHFSKTFDENVNRLTKMTVAATMEVYKAAIETFLPTPAKSHYTFSLRDFARVIGGLLMVPTSLVKDADKLIRLWLHETYRVFNDRLIDDADKYELFFNIITTLILFQIAGKCCSRL